MSASSIGMPGGQPSTTQPIAGPWLSPQVVMRNRWPKLLCDMQFFSAPVPTLSLPAGTLPLPLKGGRSARPSAPGGGQALETTPSPTLPLAGREGVTYSFATEMSGASSFFMPTTW